MVLLSGKPISDDEKPLYARDGWKIPTDIPLDPHINLREALRIDKQRNPNIILRSISEYPYDCVGMIFASRRHWIEIDHILDILDHDGYRRIHKANVIAGDVVLYKYDNEYSHIALIIQAEPIGDTMNITVVSKWGHHPEYIHHEAQVSEYLGTPVEYWTERVVV